MMWIDSHCHLTHERMAGDYTPEQLIHAAKEAGVDGMLNISCQIKGDFKDVLATAKAYDNVWCSVGTHPHDAGLDGEKDVFLQELIDLSASDKKIIAIGESGLDYYYDNSPREDQRESFRKHIRACIETGLPLIVHTRDAEEDTIATMREEGQGTALKGVMHCFSGTRDLAEKALEQGFYISFSGILTFKQAEDLRETAKIVPRDKLLVETDAPYLAPMPHRGKTNQPAYVIHTGRVLAELHDMSAEEMAAQTTDNFYTLFDKAQRS